MATTRDDSVLTSIQELQALEAARQRDVERAARETERALREAHEARLAEAERLRAAALAEAESARLRDAQAEAARAESQRVAREARELSLRVEHEARVAARAEALREAHSNVLDHARATSREGLSVVQIVAIMAAVAVALGSAAWFGVVQPQRRAHDASLDAAHARAARAEAARREADDARALAERRLQDLARTPPPSVVRAVPVDTAVRAVTTRHNAPTRVRAEQDPDIDRIDLDGPDPLSMDDGAPRRRR